MNLDKWTLYTGAIVMIGSGIYFGYESFGASGLTLWWVGQSVKKEEEVR